MKEPKKKKIVLENARNPIVILFSTKHPEIVSMLGNRSEGTKIRVHKKLRFSIRPQSCTKAEVDFSRVCETEEGKKDKNLMYAKDNASAFFFYNRYHIYC